MYTSIYTSISVTPYPSLAFLRHLTFTHPLLLALPRTLSQLSAMSVFSAHTKRAHYSVHTRSEEPNTLKKSCTPLKRAKTAKL